MGPCVCGLELSVQLAVEVGGTKRTSRQRNCRTLIRLQKSHHTGESTLRVVLHEAWDTWCMLLHGACFYVVQVLVIFLALEIHNVPK